jgi:prefoldin subunit 5
MSDDIVRVTEPVAVYPQATGLVESLKAENEKLRDEIARLRSCVEVLERIRAAADNLFTYDSGWSHWEQKYRALRAALKEAKP